MTLAISYCQASSILMGRTRLLSGKQLLKRPAVREPPAFNESRLPCLISERIVKFPLPYQHIGQIHIPSRRVLVPAKHRLNGAGELSLVFLVDAACVHSKLSLTCRAGTANPYSQPMALAAQVPSG
jgi:hypothetical protein